jgi:hypothetical protein
MAGDTLVQLQQRALPGRNVHAIDYRNNACLARCA